MCSISYYLIVMLLLHVKYNHAHSSMRYFTVVQKYQEMKNEFRIISLLHKEPMFNETSSNVTSQTSSLKIIDYKTIVHMELTC